MVEEAEEEVEGAAVGEEVQDDIKFNRYKKYVSRSRLPALRTETFFQIFWMYLSLPQCFYVQRIYRDLCLLG